MYNRISTTTDGIIVFIGFVVVRSIAIYVIYYQNIVNTDIYMCVSD